jgi:hypothetical protein
MPREAMPRIPARRKHDLAEQQAVIDGTTTRISPGMSRRRCFH